MFFCEEKYKCLQQSLLNFYAWSTDTSSSPCDNCSNCQCRNDLFILGIIIYSFVRKFFKIITYLTKINALNFKHDKRNVFFFFFFFIKGKFIGIFLIKQKKIFFFLFFIFFLQIYFLYL